MLKMGDRGVVPSTGTYPLLTPRTIALGESPQNDCSRRLITDFGSLLGWWCDLPHMRELSRPFNQKANVGITSACDGVELVVVVVVVVVIGPTRYIQRSTRQTGTRQTISVTKLGGT